jgi:hypothetical protein
LWEFKPIAYHLQDRTKAIGDFLEERNIKTSAPRGIENKEENKHLKALIDQVQRISISRPIPIIDYAANHTGDSKFKLAQVVVSSASSTKCSSAQGAALR